MLNVFFKVSIFAVIILFAAPTFGAEQSFEVCGTGDSQILLADIAKAYMKDHPDVSINVSESVGSGGGIRKTATGECALGRVARPIKEKEKKHQLSYKLFAYSPVVFIANANVTITSINNKQVIGILSGQIGNWKDIGGDDAPIYIAKRERGDSSRSVLEKNIPQLKAITNWAGKTTYSTGETVSIVQRHKNTFSFAPLAMVTNYKVNILNFNGVSPSPEKVQTGAYPLSVPLGLVWKNELTGPVRDFVDFIYSPGGQAITKHSGSIPIQ